MLVWRLCRAKYRAEAFTGEGARLHPGRWNPLDVPIVYTSTSRSLAILESFVHIDARIQPADLLLIPAEVSGDMPEAGLWAGWQGDDAITQKYGGEWAVAGRSVALYVPSVVVPGEMNVLLNPGHPAFAKVKIGKPEPFAFDERMFGK